MSHRELLKEARRLPVKQRLHLIDQLIESVESDDPEPLSVKQRKELNRRYRDYLAEPAKGEPWEVVRARIQRNLDAAKTDRSA